MFSLLLNNAVRRFSTTTDWFKPRSRTSNPPSKLQRIFSVGLCLCGLTCILDPCFGQTPVASISGYVSDSSQAVIVTADVVVRQSNTGFARKTQTRTDGFFTFENLEPGEYEIEASARGFRTSWRSITLLVGDNLNANLQLQAGPLEQRVEVTSDVAGINTTDSTVKGNVTRKQIETLPLNGRNFLELAQLTPGINITFALNPGLLGQSYLRVNIAGGFPSQTRIAIEGSTVTDRFVGGTMLNFSPEAVQEFQISTFSLDIQTGITGAGAINIVTRRGSSDVHRTAFFYFRDHNLAAYPGLRRDPRNLNPFFARRQSGFSLSGPLKRDRLFWFSNYEHHNQDAVFTIANNHPIFSKLDVIHPNPFDSNVFNLHLDTQLTDRHQMFSRFSSDRNGTLSPGLLIGMLSNWQSLSNRAIQLQAGLVSVLTPHVVNDLRFSYTYLNSNLDQVSATQCANPVACIGVGATNILIFDAPQFRIGKQISTSTQRWPRNYQIVESINWQRGTHALRFGGEWEHTYLKASLAFNEPAS